MAKGCSGAWPEDGHQGGSRPEAMAKEVGPKAQGQGWWDEGSGTSAVGRGRWNEGGGTRCVVELLSFGSCAWSGAGRSIGGVKLDLPA